MSDVLLVGIAPRSDEGRELFVSCTDYWHDVVRVCRVLFTDRFPVDATFYADRWLAPPTPHLGDAQARRLAELIDQAFAGDEVARTLDRYYREDALMVEFYGDEEDRIEAAIEDRCELIRELAAFLRASGGCEARWHDARGWG
ncbi:MAG: hypothetical protein V2J02_12475 [Pseudomonadales bacterium]|jgi:hypothetical protein|nr:hypothetical protein [Pseudomonadales bacterium]